MLKVFISWSKPRGRAVAEALRDWLPTVIQSVMPWMSAADIDAGARWLQDIMTELQETDFGIICLTPENRDAPWLNFEAGALAKSIDHSRVCPYLLDLEGNQVTGPLAQYQATEASKEGTRKLVLGINRALGSEALPDERLIKTFNKFWPDLEEKLAAIVVPEEAPSPRRSQEEMITEILELVRAEARGSKEFPYIKINPLDELIVPRKTNIKYRRDHLKGELRAEIFELENRGGYKSLLSNDDGFSSTKLYGLLPEAKLGCDQTIQLLKPHNCDEAGCEVWKTLLGIFSVPY